MKNRLLTTALALFGFTGVACAQQLPPQLFTNGPVVNQIGVGSGGGDVSAIQTDFVTFGFNCSRSANSSFGDDFTTTCGVLWTPQEIEVYAYQNDALTSNPPTINGAYVRVYDGPPGNPSSNVLFGDFINNRLISTTWKQGATPGTFTYRVPQFSLANSTRAIQAVRISLAGCPVLGSLSQVKQYWIGVTLTGNGTAPGNTGPFVIPLSPTRITDNAVASGLFTVQSPWPAARDAGSRQQVDFPFILRGTLSGTPCPAPASTELPLPTDGTFGRFDGTINPGETKFFRIFVAEPITAGLTGGNRLDIDTEGTLLFGGMNGERFNDTYIALYGDNGLRIAGFDNDSGSFLLSQLSFGQGLEFSTSDALNFDGRSGATLAAGEYYIGVTALGSTLTVLPGYTLTSNSTAGGFLTVRARVVSNVPPISPAILGAVRPFPTLVAVGIGGGFQSLTVPVARGITSWVSFVLPAAVSAIRALDIMTEGSTLLQENDCSLALYSTAGALLAVNRESGTDSLALMSFGGGFRPRVNTSWNFFGQNGILPAGTYYLAVVGHDRAGFGQTNFNLSNGGAPNTGNVNLQIRYKTSIAGDFNAAPVLSTDQDFGVLNGGIVTKELTVNRESITFFKFEIPADNPAVALIIDTEDSDLFPLSDTAIQLFDAQGGTPSSVGETDSDRGSGFLSQLAFGPTEAGSTIFNTPSLAQRANGRTADFPGSGVYYLGVRTGNDGFAVPDWNLNSDGPNSGRIRVNIRLVLSPMPTVSEPPSAAFDIPELGGRQTFVVNLAPYDVVWVKFRYPVGAGITDYVDLDTGRSRPVDSYLAMYNNLGELVATNDDSGSGLLSMLSFGAGSGPRVPSGTTGTPNGQNGTLIADKTYWLAAALYDASLYTGPTNWDFRNENTQFTERFTVTVRSSFAPVFACIADVTGDGTIDGSDFIAFINSFAAGDPILDPTADVNQDSIIDGNDFVLFINAFGAGC